jgi:subtilisin family serine protease
MMNFPRNRPNAKSVFTMKLLGSCVVGTLVALCASVNAATVEFKLHPDLKGRAYKQAMSFAASHGTVEAADAESGTLKIQATSAADASRIATQLRGAGGVLWAQLPAVALPEGTQAAASRFHGRALTITVKAGQDAKAAVARISAATAQNLTLRRVASGNRAVVILPVGATAATLAAVSVAASNDSAVASADRVRLFAHQWIPNDLLYGQQWSLGNGVGGIRASLAWDLTPSGSVNVAVIDTGIRSHPDLDGKYVSGYDMISNNFVAVDGDLRDADPADPGDADIDLDCSSPLGAYSSWHGTHVAGIVGATAQNGEGVAGVAPNARIQSIRALGRCGGLDIDVADSIRWAAGVPIPGVPNNPNPAKVMNLSLGGLGPCSKDEQAAVDAAIARGSVVVVAAGNDETFASQFSPANCKGVIAVAASNLLGDLSSYSNFGPEVAISAPGGDFGNLPGVLSTLNGGGTQPAVPSYAEYSGTSMAAPHVAGVVALMLARNPSLTPGQVLNTLKSSARPFPAGSACAGTTEACGAGLLDAANAVAAVAINRGLNETSGRNDRLHLVELANPSNGRYTLSADPVEVATMVSGGWTRTGQLIPTYSFTAIGQAVDIPQAVCRAQLLGHESWRFSANTGDCKEYASNASMKSDGMVFMAALPNANACPRGSLPAWEFVRQDAVTGLYNFRTLVDSAEMQRMIDLKVGWIFSRVAFCIPN